MKLFRAEDFMRDYKVATDITLTLYEAEARQIAKVANKILKKWLEAQPEVYGDPHPEDADSFRWCSARHLTKSTHKARLVGIEPLEGE
jgi:hypothetical protein